VPAGEPIGNMEIEVPNIGQIKPLASNSVICKAFGLIILPPKTLPKEEKAEVVFAYTNTRKAISKI